MKGLGEYGRKVAGLITGVGSAHVVALLFVPIITRLFAPDAIGQMALVLSLGAVLAVFVTLKLENAVLVPTKRDEAVLMVRTTVTLVTLLGLVLVLVINSALVVVRHTSAIEIEVSHFVLTLTVGVSAVLALYNIFVSYLVREERYRAISVSRVMRQIGEGGFATGLGLLGGGAKLLPVAVFVGLLCAFLLLANAAREVFAAPVATWRNVVDTVRRYKEFAIYDVPASLITVLNESIPIIFITTFYGAEEAGLYAITTKLIGAPISLIANTIGLVYRQEAASEIHSSGNCVQAFLRGFVLLMAIAAGLAIIVMGFRAYIVAWLLDEAWKDVEQLIVYLLPLFAARVVASPLSYVMYLRRALRVNLLLQVVAVVLTVLTYGLGGFDATFEKVVQAYGAVFFCFYGVYTYVSYRFARCEKIDTRETILGI